VRCARRRARRPHGLGLLLGIVLALATQGAAARWYQVEVVVFRQPPGAPGADELWPELLAQPDFSRAVRLQRDLPPMDDEPPAAAAGEPTGPVAFTPLAASERRLAGVARRVDGGGYQLLLATGWRQPGFGTAQPRRVYVSDREEAGTMVAADTLAPPPGELAALPRPGVEGTVAIKVARLLHVELDLVLDHDGVPVRLSETRRVKLREIHYFDHPLFGAVVQVSPYSLPDVDETSTVGADEPDDPDGAEIPAATAP
ncbi:MAG: CsiV family protein, partial [Gammaproteobacteria bacterium]